MSGRPNRGYSYARRRPSGGADVPYSREEGRAAPGDGAASLAARRVLPEDWRTRTYLALDFETTGLDPARERVVEIGALRFRFVEPCSQADLGPLFAAAFAEDAACGCEADRGGEAGRGAADRGGAFRGAAGASGPGATGDHGEERLALGEEGSLSLLVNPGKPIPPATTAIHGIRDKDVEGGPSFAALAPALAELARGAVIIAHNAPFDLSFLRAELSRAGLPPAANEVLDTRIVAKAAFPGLPSYRLVDLAARLGIGHARAHRALDDARACAELFLASALRLDGGKTR